MTQNIVDFAISCKWVNVAFLVVEPTRGMWTSWLNP